MGALCSHVNVTELQSRGGSDHTGLRRHCDEVILEIPGGIPTPVRGEVAVGVIGECFRSFGNKSGTALSGLLEALNTEEIRDLMTFLLNHETH